MGKTIISLEYRGGHALMYHWFMYNIGGLYKWEKNGGCEVYMPWLSPDDENNWAPWVKETIPLLLPEFECKKGEAPPEAITEHGATLYAPDRTEPLVHSFLRNFFLEKCVYHNNSCNGLFYITRAGSSRRHILNEDDFIPRLKELGFVYIKLEELNLKEKVNLFANAKVVISPQSAGLTFACAAPMAAHIIEVYPDNGLMRHYDYLCSDLGIGYTRFSDGVETVGCMDDIYNGDYNFIVTNTDKLVDTAREKMMIISGPPNKILEIS